MRPLFHCFQRGLVSLIGALFATAFAGMAANAQQTVYKWPQMGGNGGGPKFELRCNPKLGSLGLPMGHIYVVGVEGYAGAWVDKLWLLCGQGMGGYVTDPGQMGTAGKGEGGEHFKKYCGTNSVVTGIQLNTVEFNGTNVINKLVLECNIYDNRVRPPNSQFHRMVFGRDDSQDGHPLLTQRCRPDFSRVTGFTIRDGLYVDSLGIICTNE